MEELFSALCNHGALSRHSILHTESVVIHLEFGGHTHTSLKLTSTRLDKIFNEEVGELRRSNSTQRSNTQNTQLIWSEQNEREKTYTKNCFN